MSYDSECYALAEYFLDHEPHQPGDTDALAQLIQDAIELFLEFDLPRRFPQEPRDE